MKHVATLTALFASVTCLAAAPAVAADAPAPAPTAPTKPAAAHPAKRPHPSFWLAAEPHVPLAWVQGHTIHSIGTPGKTCGSKSRWAHPKSKWKAIDAWGQVAGISEVAGSELYDVTHCREVFFTPKSGSGGTGLFVSDDSPWAPPPSVAWTPAKTEMTRLEHLVDTIEEAWVEAPLAHEPLPLAKRVMFFDLAPGEGEATKSKAVAKVDAKPAKADAKAAKVEAKPNEKSAAKADQVSAKAAKAKEPAAKKDAPIEGDVTAHRPRHWAVAGGPILVVAYLGEQGHWKVATVKPPLGLADSYKPVAVFDINGDGVPEIIYHSSDGPGFGDSVLSLPVGSMTWTDAAESPGGGTL